jgi:hypothetical protein
VLKICVTCVSGSVIGCHSYDSAPTHGHEDDPIFLSLLLNIMSCYLVYLFNYPCPLSVFLSVWIGLLRSLAGRPSLLPPPSPASSLYAAAPYGSYGEPRGHCAFLSSPSQTIAFCAYLAPARLPLLQVPVRQGQGQ